MRDTPDQSQALLGFIEAISAELELRPLLMRIVEHACTLIGADRGAIGLVDGARNLVRTEAIYHMPADELGREMPLGVGLAGAVLRTMQPLVLDRYGSIEHPIYDEHHDDAVLGVPILWEGRMIGFFGIGNSPTSRGNRARTFRPDDVQVLQLFARHAAIAIVNARRYAEGQRRGERFELIARIGRLIMAAPSVDDLLRNATDAIREVLGYADVAITPVDPDMPPPVDTPAEYAALGGDQTAIAVPILLGDELLAVIRVACAVPLTEEDRVGMQIVADQLAIALENTRLYEQSTRLATLQERERIARDLHDSVTQQLFGLAMIAESIAPTFARDPEEGQRRAARVLELSRAALAEMRALLAELRADGDETSSASAGAALVRRRGLAAALREYARRAAMLGTHVSFDASGYLPLPTAVETTLYRFAQEALHNALKHAHADHIRLHLERTDRRVRVLVQDDGVGFQMDGSTDIERMGMRHMRERIASLDGILQVRSAPGAGTSVEAYVPVRSGRA